MGRRRYTDDQLRVAVAASKTMREVLVRLGLVPYGGNYETTRRRIAALDLDAPHLLTSHTHAHRLRSLTDEQFLEAVRTSRSLAQVLSRLGMRPTGDRRMLKKRLESLGADTSHFLGQGWKRNDHRATVPARPLTQILVEGHLERTSRLRMRLIAEGLKEPRCENCHRGEWNSLPIPLELDHVNGKRNDNRLVNLRLLCPNCHAQTDTYRGRNIGRGRYSRDSPGGENGQPHGS